MFKALKYNNERFTMPKTAQEITNLESYKKEITPHCRMWLKHKESSMLWNKQQIDSKNKQRTCSKKKYSTLQ
jgi:hypothetical protein